MTLLRDEEWAGWNDREISRRCRVHHTLVGRLRPAPASDPSLETSTSDRTYKTKHGTTATMKTAGINAKRPKAQPKGNDRVPWPEKPEHQVKQERAEIADRFQLFDALEALSTITVSPADFAKGCPEHSVYRVDEHLESAVDWLNKFSKEWGTR